jgi:hypothetical protein
MLALTISLREAAVVTRPPWKRSPAIRFPSRQIDPAGATVLLTRVIEVPNKNAMCRAASKLLAARRFWHLHPRGTHRAPLFRAQSLRAIM